MSDLLKTIIGIAFISLCTTIGASFVFVFKNKKISQKINQIFVGFAAGIMLSASVFSLILPAIEIETNYMPSYIIVVIAIILGALFLFAIDKLLPHIHALENKEEGLQTDRLDKIQKMFLAVTIHNVPEGLSVGIAFGVALAISKSQPSSLEASSAMMGAIMLAIGIGIQNIPEGAVVSLPVYSETNNLKKSFFFGTFSGLVEPIAAVIGLFLAYKIQAIMPWALAFAAGCMLYVICEEMIPDAQSNPHNHYGVWSFILGFVLMLVLDVALG